MDNSIESFREKLDQEYNWPSLYTFKFIVPVDNISALKKIFQNHTVTEKKSRNGNYVSITAEVMAQSSDYIINVYLEANKVEGVISL
ncbi:DUF493 domain-containing protein [Fulvivirga sp. M361]|uniref:DUF493 family protein n=1 Tax=Fulvivirga sp. M361 TaxID=2594266 RepID=UPI001179EA43|nr:DUF493 family protein [Fulvivirga sp. M361]TRX61328.1 DUF493 domain-containing protein [Fulvivirga sp. M361]